MYEDVSKAVQDQELKLPAMCNSTFCPQADFAGCVLRVAGHDMMDYDASARTGGSDGCMDMSHEDNTGLAPCMVQGEHGQALIESYSKFCEDVSLADFLVIAAEAIMTQSRQFDLRRNRRGAKVDFISHFQYGRTTETSCPGSGDRLPAPTGGCDIVDTVFIQNMGLTWRETTALMGVHTLGRANTGNSGYAGWWSDAKNGRKFNNDYYISMRDKGWVPMADVCGNTGKHQWIMSGPGGMPDGEATQMMLDTDLCLAYEIPRGSADEKCCAWLGEPNDFFDICGADFDTAACGDSPECDCGQDIEKLTGRAADHVNEFADDEAAWLEVFQEAWTKATSNGFRRLHTLEDSC